MEKPLNIVVLEDGPLKVSAEDLTLKFCGEPVDVVAGEDVFLCRCGESKNPPFCDGSHKGAGFSGAVESGEKKDVHVWEGKTIRTFFNPNACMHVFYCRPLKALREQELAGDAAAAEEIARVVQSCPSGALSFESKTVQLDGHADRPTEIEIMEGGEIRIKCEFAINEDLQERQSNDRATLCRCGLSKNKPWCDGRHKKKESFK